MNLLDLPLEHFRKYVRLSEWQLPPIDPEDRDRVDDRDLVRATVRDFEELADLSDEDRERLVADIVIAIWAWRAGVDIEKRGLSNEKEAIYIFLSNVGCALERATGVSATRWRKTYDRGDGAAIKAPRSFYFRLVRALGNEFGIPMPKDLMRPTGRASEIRYVMSPAMRAWQDAELVARARRHLDDLAVRLKTCSARGDLRLTTATGLAVLEPETVYENLSPELRLLALGLSSAQTWAGSSLAR